VNRALSIASSLLLASTLGYSTLAQTPAAQTSSTRQAASQPSAVIPALPDISNIRIRNFGRVSGEYYRGAQPEGQDYKALAALGVKTVIDLERTGDTIEQQAVESAGMKFYRIELSDRAWPDKDNVGQFLQIVDDSSNLPVYVHCHGGKHRTGAMTAVYRISHDGWTADQAFDEMKQYEFEQGVGHGVLKHFVYDYYANKPVMPAAPTVAAADAPKAS
jgi:tyrosine-protein phosphatase SIW14